MLVTIPEIDAATGEDFWTELAPHLPSRPGDELVIDLRDVRFMASIGISMLLKANAHAGRTGGRIVLANPQPAIARLLDVTGVADLLQGPSDPGTDPGDVSA